MAVDYDIAIIGAGAAGIAAARQLADTVHSVIVLEASQRLGGRAWTLGLGAMTLDIGCGWLHSAGQNPLVELGERAGFMIERGSSAWGQQWRNLGFPADEQAQAASAWDTFVDRLRVSPPGADVASDALEPGGRWNAYCQSLSGYLNGAELDSVSVADFLAYDNTATDDNWRAYRGYGSLIISLIPERQAIRFSSPIRSIKLGGEGVELRAEGSVITSRAVIVTVATDVLTRGLIEFDKAATDHLEAASRLPLGRAEKIFLALSGQHELETETHLLGNPHATKTGSYYIKPLGQPVVEGFFGGEGASLFGEAGLQDAYALALDELVALLGADIRRRVKFLAASSWMSTDWIYGSYSHALPGHAKAREVLARPIDDRIFFAGEATHPVAFSTAHGAWESGIRAAKEVMTALR